VTTAVNKGERRKLKTSFLGRDRPAKWGFSRAISFVAPASLRNLADVDAAL